MTDRATTPAQAASARARANRASAILRASRAGAKADLRSGRLTIFDVLVQPPAALVALPLWDLLRFAPGFGVERRIVINRRAIDAKVNLALPLGRASQLTRRWLSDALTSLAPACRRQERTSGTSGWLSEALTGDAPGPPRDPRAEQLAQAIAAHRTAIRGPGPVDGFGAADDTLYERCAQIMATVDEQPNRLAEAA